ncbi:MAG: LysE family transporter [Alphaproteobacteria bacterium]|nr:LysE family transporter [Alphaproteobacteria bacterium]
MDLALFIKGLIVGFVIAAPVGPVNILCIHRTLTVGRRSGLISGVGAALADTFFGIIAAFGLTLIADFLIAQQFWLRTIGGIIIITLGIRALFYKPKPPGSVERRWHKRIAGDFTSTFALTITNPITIFSFVAIFATANAVVPEDDLSAALALIAGVFVGSQMWWSTLTFGSGMFRHRLDEDALRWLSRISGALIILCGAVALLSVVPPFNKIFEY